jgi:hypothetical protein
MIQDQAAGDSVAQALRPSGSPTSGLLIAHVDGAARWAPRLASFALGTGCLVALVHAALLVPLHVPLNYNEGWNAYHALEAARGAPLYPAAPQFFFNNYPPLWFYLSAAMVRLSVDPIVAGRWMSLAGFAGWAFLLARIAEAFGCRPSSARFAGLLFAANTLAFTDYVGIDDPEFVAHLIAATGLLLIAAPARSPSRAYAAGLLLAVALFVKHSLVVLPVACVLWLLAIDRGAAWRLLAAIAAGVIVGGAACAWLFGPGFFTQLASPRGFSVARALGKSSLWLARMFVPVSAAVVLVRRRGRQEVVAFCALYAGLAIAAGMILIGGDGVNWNVFFDATWAVCLSAAVALDQLPVPTGGRFRRAGSLAAAYLVAPALALMLHVGDPWLTADYWLHGKRAAAARNDVSFIANQPGHAVCEDLALCSWAGKPAEIDVFNTQQRILAGSLRSDDLVRLLDARYYAIVELGNPGRRLGAAFDDALARNYRLLREVDDRQLFVPR